MKTHMKNLSCTFPFMVLTAYGLIFIFYQEPQSSGQNVILHQVEL